MFYVNYAFSELRRRAGRTLLTALGLGVGVGLVVAVTALSDGLDEAQDKVLQPLTGVGTDMSVTRPLNLEQDGSDGSGGGFGPGANLSDAERKTLEEENGGGRLDLADVGEPGEKYSRTSFLTTTQLSFPEDEVDAIRGIDGVADAAGSLTLSAVTISGTVPKGGLQAGAAPPAAGGGGQRQDIDFESVTVTGVDVAKSDLAAASPGAITDGEYLSADGSRQAVLNVSYAQRNDIEVGDRIKLKNRSYTVVGLAQSPLGGQASDVYVKLGQLQKAAGREDRVNTVQVRADGTDAVGPVENAISSTLSGASTTTAADLAERVGGSLTDAKNLSSKLGAALTIVALVAAFMIASLLTLSSVTKRIRELGTLKALGWPQRKVVRQVTAESVAQGALGGIVGALVGIAAAAIINAVGITLQATVAAPDTAGAFPGAGRGGGFGAGAVTAGTADVALEAPVNSALILLAISLALLGGLIAGSAGGLRAARLRPADALRHIG